MERGTRPISTTSISRPTTRRREVDADGLSWIDLPQPVSADIAYLRERLRLDPLALDDALSTIQRPKLDVHDAEEYLFLVVHVPVLDRDQRIVVSEVDIFVGREFLVTFHDNTMKPLRRLFAAVAGDEAVRKQVMTRGSGFLLYRILDALTKQSFAITFHVDEHLNRLRSKLFVQEAAKSTEQHALLEQDVITLRRIVQPNLDVAEQLRHSDLPFLEIDAVRWYGDIADGAAKLNDIASEQRELLASVGATLAVQGVQSQTATLRTITVAVVTLVPLVALAAIAVLAVAAPPTERLIVFVAALLVVAALIGGLLWGGKQQHWF